MPPDNAHRIMKLDPNNNDSMSSVGDDLGDDLEYTYIGKILVRIDGCVVYGMPVETNCIIKYDPINDITSLLGEEGR